VSAPVPARYPISVAPSATTNLRKKSRLMACKTVTGHKPYHPHGRDAPHLAYHITPHHIQSVHGLGWPEVGFANCGAGAQRIISGKIHRATTLWRCVWRVGMYTGRILNHSRPSGLELPPKARLEHTLQSIHLS
jgi:hypothetical protein